MTFFVRVPGLEPGAFWFVAKRSIQLGYIRLSLRFKYSILFFFVKGVGLFFVFFLHFGMINIFLWALELCSKNCSLCKKLSFKAIFFM